MRIALSTCQIAGRNLDGLDQGLRPGGALRRARASLVPQVSTIVDVRSVVDGLPRVDLLHINCEGCELRVLRRLTEAAMTKVS